MAQTYTMSFDNNKQGLTATPDRPLIRQYQMHTHMSFAKEHWRMHTGIIDWPGNFIDGMTINVKVVVPKKPLSQGGGYGRARIVDVGLSKEGEPQFTSTQLFLQYYKEKGTMIAKEPEPVNGA